MLETIEPLLRLLTPFGDAGFVLPAAGGLAVALWAAGDRRAAVALLVAIVVCGAAATVAKIVVMAFATGPAVHSPSGHTALATGFFLPLAAIFARARGRGGRLCAALALTVGPLVGLGRIAAGAHTPAETLIGFAIGLAAFALFLRLAPPREGIGAAFIVLFLLAAVVLHASLGVSIDMEPELEAVAARLARALRS